MTKRDDSTIAPKKAITLLKEAPERLELLLRWCPEKDGARARPGECSIRTVVGQLGTLDRHHYLESAKRLLGSGTSPKLPGLEPGTIEESELADCELAELVTRFRHMRAQSTEFLERVPEEAWSLVGSDPDLGSLTLSQIISHWVNHDAATLDRLDALCEGLNQT
jgi:hypothetical protein